jgi:hypothetical protein
MVGKTGSYLYLPEGLDFTAYYNVRLTRTDNGENIWGCPYRPENKQDINATPIIQNVQGAPLKVMSPKNGVLEIWSTTGFCIGRQNIQQNVSSSINILLSNGMYVCRLILEDGSITSYRVVINR